jgi:predicted amidohydrolase YtcJ
MELLNRDGFTAIQDAAVRNGITTRFYDLLRSRKQLTVRVNLTQLYEPEDYRRPDGSIDYDAIVAKAKALRAVYAGDPLIKSDAVKVFADGVLEGNPRADPPTLPDSPMIRPFLQPIFGTASDGSVTVNGYVDTASPLCAGVRDHPGDYETAAVVETFRASHGYHPMQCLISSGKLQHERSVFMDYLRHMHLAGFTLHIHAIGDEAVRTAVDGIEAARAADGNNSRPDTIAHLQVVAPEDVKRIGRDHLYTVYTFGWAQTDPAYDRTVIPFIQRVKDGSYASLHEPGSYYERQAYPARSTTAAGAVLVAGSDAPVDDRDPRPFVNIATGITRQLRGQPPLGPQERLDVRALIDAYTINSARALGRAAEIGSLEPGKSADFVLLDRDIVALADGGKAADIAGTKVLGTWFQGRQVYSAQAPETAK